MTEIGSEIGEIGGDIVEGNRCDGVGAVGGYFAFPARRASRSTNPYSKPNPELILALALTLIRPYP